MKYIQYLFICLFIIAACCKTLAQNNEDARVLVKEGVKLNDEKNYSGAIENYTRALKLDTGNLYADYQIAYTLFLSDKGREGIPYLEKVVKGDTKITLQLMIC
jgi:tetratricopeptide (TPR) repeat protein